MPSAVPSPVEIPSLPARADRGVGRLRARSADRAVQTVRCGGMSIAVPVVVQLLTQAGGDLDARTPWLRARDVGVVRTTVNELIESSPVRTPVVSPRPPRAAPQVRLIGRGPRGRAAR